MGDTFSWDHLSSVPRPDEVFTAFTAVYLALCAVSLLVGFGLYNRPGVMWARHLLRVRTARRWGSILLWIGSLGIFFFVVGWLQINPFTLGTRFWLYLTALVWIIAVVLIAIDLRVESRVLSREQIEHREAVAKGVHMRRPPKRSRTRKR